MALLIPNVSKVLMEVTNENPHALLACGSNPN
jgi:hypothetical protein